MLGGILGGGGGAQGGSGGGTEMNPIFGGILGNNNQGGPGPGKFNVPGGSKASEYGGVPTVGEMHKLTNDPQAAVNLSKKFVSGHEKFLDTLFLEKVRDCKEFWTRQNTYPGKLTCDVNIGPRVNLKYTGKWNVFGSEGFVAKTLGHRKVVMVLLRSDPIHHVYLYDDPSMSALCKQEGTQGESCLDNFCNDQPQQQSEPCLPCEDDERWRYNYYMYMDSDENGNEVGKQVRKLKIDPRDLIKDEKDEDPPQIPWDKNEEVLIIQGDKMRKPAPCKTGHMFFTKSKKGKKIVEDLKEKERSDERKYRTLWILTLVACFILYFLMPIGPIIGILLYFLMSRKKITRVKKWEYHRYALVFMPVGAEANKMDQNDVMVMQQRQMSGGGCRMKTVGAFYEQSFWALCKYLLLHEILVADIRGILNYQRVYRMSQLKTLELLKQWRMGLKTPEYLFSRLTKTPYGSGESVEEKIEIFEKHLEENPDLHQMVDHGVDF